MRRPPFLARLALRLLLRGEAYDVIAGDLEETFHRLPVGRERARWYRRAVVRALASRARFRFAPVTTDLPREARTMPWDQFRSDLRFSLRSYRRQPGVAFVIVVTLTLGIGATVAMFSVLDAALLAPLPYAQPDRLVSLWERNETRGWTWNQASPANFFSWRERAESIEHASAHGWVTGWAFVADGGAEWLRGTPVYGGFFTTFGLPMTLGRDIGEADVWDRERVIVISEGLWTRAYGRDPDVIGKPIVLDDIERRIVGVAPAGFAYPEPGLDLWSPFRWRPEDQGAAWFRRAHMIRPVARLRPGATVATASAELDAIATALQAEFPDTNEGMGAGAVGLHEWVVGDRSAALLVLMGAVSAMLLTACANIAGLLMTRSAGRVREIAVRSALGAGRARIVRQLVTENLLLSALGGAAGVLLAWRLTPVLVALGGDAIPRAADIGIDARVLGFAVVTTVLTGLLFSLVPALQLPGAGMREALREGAGQSGSRSRENTRRVLVVAEVALAVVLVAGAAVLFRSLTQLSRIDPGFDPDGLLVAELNLGSADRYPDAAAINGFRDQLRARLEAHPVIERVAYAETLPLAGPTWTSDFFVEGYEVRDALTEFNRRVVDSAYLETMRVPLLAGRGFSSNDGPDSEPVVMVNETLVARYFGADDPVGRRIRFGADDDDPWYRVIGVTGSEKLEGLDSRAWPEVLVPLQQSPGWGMKAIVRTVAGAGRVDGVFRDELAAVDPLAPIVEITRFEERVRSTITTERLLALISSTFASITLFLAALGIYGLMAQSVQQRTREIGIRMALGAAAGDVVGAVVRNAAKLVGSGLALGLVAYWLASGWLAALLFDLSPTDIGTLGLVAAALTAAGLLAAWLPARRAAAVDPVRSLRAD